MKIIKPQYVSFLALFLLGSCMRSTSLTALQPAQMKLPDHIAKGFKSQMEKAYRYAQGQNWDGAAEIWKNIVERAGDDAKTAGKAAYNMAVAAEIRGNLDLALEWAQKAWNNYGNKKARNYIYILKQRKNDASKLEYQMPGKRV